ncbi:amidohydrolase family protein [Kribbella sancticallisti]
MPERFAIVGARVMPITGAVIDNGAVIVAGGRIESVGTADSVPAHLSRVDATGRWLLPGLVDAHTRLGIVEEANGWSGADAAEPASAANAGLRARDAVSPSDLGLQDAISGGVLAAGVDPSTRAPIGGQSVAIRCWGTTVDEMVLRDPCGVRAALGEQPKRTDDTFPITRMGVAAVIRAALVAARGRLDDPDAAEGSEQAALAAALRGEIPWRQHAHRADDIATALRIADEFGLRLVIDRGTEADRLAGELAGRGIPVVVGPLTVNRRGVEMKNRSLQTAQRLAAAGVRIAFTTGAGTVPVQFLAHQASFAVREGLDRDTALAGLTIEPARILGVEDRIGSLEPGKHADLCLWSGDPLDPRHRVVTAYLGGREIYRFDPGAGVGRFGDLVWLP